MVIANNAIRLHTIKRRIIEDQQAFSETDHKSISTIDRIPAIVTDFEWNRYMGAFWKEFRAGQESVSAVCAGTKCNSLMCN